MIFDIKPQKVLPGNFLLVLINCLIMKNPFISSLMNSLKPEFMSLKTQLILTLLSALLLVMAFPDFDFWQVAWFALVPFFWAIYTLRSFKQAFLLGWIWGVVFFFGSCWWLSYAPIHYGGVPVFIAYLLIFISTVLVGFFIAIFSIFLLFFLRQFGTRGVLFAPFLWISLEFLRFWITGNNWNAIAYSQAFVPEIVRLASIGGIYLVGVMIVGFNACSMLLIKDVIEKKRVDLMGLAVLLIIICLLTLSFLIKQEQPRRDVVATAIVLQPNVPMSGLNKRLWDELMMKHVEMTESALKNLNSQEHLPILVIFPESPMNFSYGLDENQRNFFNEFTARHRISLLFNSAEPNEKEGNFFNSAIMVNEKGEKVGQYDKMFLVPFGEYAPVPEFIKEIVPTLVGNFAFGSEYDLFSLGGAKIGVMICFESHFPNLSREYAKRGANVLIEMTNDGYLGKTPVLRQHLANAVFRAAETNLPLIRATNVGITAYITENGRILDEANTYEEAVRVWNIEKSDGHKTFYVRYGDWLPILSLIFTFTAYIFKSIWT